MGLHLVMIGISAIGIAIIKLAKKFHLGDFFAKKLRLLINEEEEMIMWHAGRCLLGDHVAVRVNPGTHRIECYNTKTGKTVKIKDLRGKMR